MSQANPVGAGTFVIEIEKATNIDEVEGTGFFDFGGKQDPYVVVKAGWGDKEHDQTDQHKNGGANPVFDGRHNNMSFEFDPSKHSLADAVFNITVMDHEDGKEGTLTSRGEGRREEQPAARSGGE